MTEVELAEQQWRMASYPPKFYRLAHILEERKEIQLIHKFENFGLWWNVLLIFALAAYFCFRKKKVDRGKIGTIVKFCPIVILTLGLGLFCYRIGSIPPGVYSDETVVGYNALSIWQTLKDEYGQKLPIYFRFFGSYTPGLMVYLQALVVGLFGLSGGTIRLISAISMIVVVGLIYLFLKEFDLEWRGSRIIGLVFFLITPWVVFNARIGYETTFALALLAAGTILYRRPIWSFGLISLSTYAGHTERYLAPMLILLIFWNFYRKKWREIKMALIVALLIQIPNLVLITCPAFWVKSEGLGNGVLERLLSYWSPINLFNKGDFDLQRSIPELSVFYPWMFLPWIVGFYVVFKNLSRPVYRFLLGLAIVCPVPAALANVNFSTQRALPLLLPYFVIMVLGMDRIFSGFGKWQRIIVIVGLVGWSGIMLFRSYFVLFPAMRMRAWNFGYEKVAEMAAQNPQKYFVVDSSRGVPYSLLLFYLKYPPAEYQKQSQVKKYYYDVEFSGETKFANVETRSIIWKDDVCKNQILVGDNLAISEEQAKEHFLVKMWEIRDYKREIILQAYETDPLKKCGLLVK